MAWPEIAFVGDYVYIVNQLARSANFSPYELTVVTYEPPDAPADVGPGTVAVFTDQRELFDRYPVVPTLGCFKHAARHLDLGKWSVSFRGVGLEGSLDAVEVGSSDVSDDGDVQGLGTLFIFAAIQHSLSNDGSAVDPDERVRIQRFVRELSTLLSMGSLESGAAAAVRTSVESMRNELSSPAPDRMIIRRSLSRIEQSAGLFLGDEAGPMAEELTELIQNLRIPRPS